ncbi:MAG: thioredoxin family protein [Lutimonas sp.]
MEHKEIITFEDFSKILKGNIAVLFYFSTISCSVGESILPKLKSLFAEHFPKILFCEIDMNRSAELSATCQVFVEPTVLIYFDGKETIRRSRNLSLLEIEQSTMRLYKILFSG